MSEHERSSDGSHGVDAAPGDEESVAEGVRNYLIGLGLAAVLTVASFWVASGTACSMRPESRWRWRRWRSRRWACISRSSCTSPPGPDNMNNSLALAFGVLIVGIVIAGSLWIMYHMNMNMGIMPASDM